MVIKFTRAKIAQVSRTVGNLSKDRGRTDSKIINYNAFRYTTDAAGLLSADG